MHSEMTKLKRGAVVCGAVAALCVLCFYLIFNTSFAQIFKKSEAQSAFKTSGTEIQILKDGQYVPFEMKGINIGTGYPGVFPNEFGIDKATYYRWFEMIGEMNANTIRVYKIQSPQFYEAFAEYNQSNDKKLYLIQSVDFSEKIMYSNKNLFDVKQKDKVFNDTFDVIDALHGNGTVYDKEAKTLGIYNDDVSDYVLGYVLGIEWDEVYVEFICKMNENASAYKGEYLYSREGANPFEIFLSEWGDRVLKYENDKYGAQKLVSFANWPETDPFDNETDPLSDYPIGIEENTEAFVDIEKIGLTDKVKSGMFASYNVYPYFPRFLQYGEYTTYTDETERQNPYRNYLTELADYHSYPVIVTEYGVPASRNSAYDDVYRGLSHGGLNEKEQGEALVTLYNDIKKSGCAGSLAFSWQDEWYKKIWNEKLISDPDGRAYWSNAQSAEQFYGLLAFEPGDGKVENYPDGNISEWSEKDLVSDNGKTKLSMKSDEKYVYFMAQGLDKREGHSCVKIALDVTPKSGALKQGVNKFDEPIDFIININSNGESELLVQNYSDITLYSLNEDDIVPTPEKLANLAEKYNLPLYSKRDSESFTTVSRARGSIFGYMQKRLAVDKVGRLKHGNTNPKSESYDPNADYFIGDGFVEIRIPWQLLNFYNPAKRMIVDDYRENDYKIKGLKIKEINAAAYYDDSEAVSDFGAYKLKGWDKPQYHERVKESYYALREAFKG